MTLDAMRKLGIQADILDRRIFPGSCGMIKMTVAINDIIDAIDVAS
jgi:hypothetical protein